MKLRAWHFAVALCARLLWAWYFWGIGTGEPGGMHEGRFIYDTQSYLGSIESLLAGKGYDPDLRMPGYGAPYFLLRQLFARDQAIVAMLILQILLGALSTVLLAVIANRLSRSTTVFHAVFWIGAICPTPAEYDLHLLTETLAIAAVVIGTWAMLRYAEAGVARWILLCGAMLCWATFLRPASGVLLPAFVVIAWLARSVAWPLRVKHTLLFALPFLLFDGAWTMRNHHVHGGFRPLTNGFYERETEFQPYFPIVRLVMAYGGYYVWWDPKADIQWFIGRDWKDGAMAPVDAADPRVPEAIMNSAFNRDSLELVARDYHRAANAASSVHERDSLFAAVRLRCDAYREALMRERPFQFHVAARWRMLKAFLWHSGTETVFPVSFAEMGPLGKTAKLLFSGIFLFGLLGGLLASLLWMVTLRPVIEKLVPLIVIAGVLIYPWGFRVTEYRYLVTVWPFAMMMGCWAVGSMVRYRKARGVISPPVG